MDTDEFIGQILHRSDIPAIDLGTQFEVYLCWGLNLGEFTIEQFIASLESTTTLIDLTIRFDYYNAAQNHPVLDPLCRCLANLRHHNQHHPLRRLTFAQAEWDSNGLLRNACEQCIGAAKRGGIFTFIFCGVFNIPVQFLLNLGYDREVKGLELAHVCIGDGGAEVPFPPMNDPGIVPHSSSTTLVPFNLTLYHIWFENSMAATNFSRFLANTNVTALRLAKIAAHCNDFYDDEDSEENSYHSEDTDRTKVIVSELKLPSVMFLDLDVNCQIDHFRAALEVEVASVIELDFCIDFRMDETTAKVECLTKFIRDAVKLLSLIIRFVGNAPSRNPIDLLLQAMEACATVLVVKFHDDEDETNFSPADEQKLERVMIRNEELDNYVENPSTYPDAKLLWLMLQFDNCPTGRYLLARHLPEVLSFETKIEESQSKQKKRKREREQRLHNDN